MTRRTWRQTDDDAGGMDWQGNGFAAVIRPAPVRKWSWKVGRDNGAQVEWVLGGLVASCEIAVMAADEGIDQLLAASQVVTPH